MSLTGGHMHPCRLGQVIRLCLACRVVPVFTPERGPATNARVERYNGLWQEKVWKRYRFRTLGQLQRRSLAFHDAYTTHLKQRLNRQGSPAIIKADLRFLPPDLRWGHPLPLYRGQIWLIRRVNEQGHIQILNEQIRLPLRYAQEFVRVVIRTGPQTLSVYWRPSAGQRFTRINHRSYQLRENARTPQL